MSLRTRRTVFQLTPLLDLLLIVIFAQYMDVRQAGARQEAWFEKEAGQVQAQAIAKAEQEAERRQQADIKLALAEKQLKTLQEEQGMTEELLTDLKIQRELMAELLTQSLKIDAEKIEELMQYGRDEANFDAKLRETIETLSESSQAEAVSLATSYHELLKRCDVWDFRFELSKGVSKETIAKKTSGATISFNFRDNHKEFLVILEDGARVIKDDQLDKTVFEIKNYLKTLPQPKGIVIVISGFMNEEITFGLRTEYKELLQKLINELTLESAGQSRFYLRELGYLGDLESNLSPSPQD